MNETNPAAPATSSSPSLVVFFARINKYLTTVKRRWWVLVLATSIGLCLAAWINSQKSPSFLSVGRMMVSGRIALPEGAVYSEEVNNFYGTQSELMQSAEVKRRAAARVESSPREVKPCHVELDVNLQKGTSFFILTAVGDEPTYTQAFLDACMEEYVRFKRELRSETSDIALTSITDELLKLDKDLESGQDELLTFQKNNNVVSLEEEGNSAAKYLAQLNHQLAGLKTEYQLLDMLDLDQTLERQQQSVSVTDPDASGKQDVTALGPQLDYLKAKQQVQLLKAEKDKHARYMRPKHPLIVKIDGAIAQQERLIALFREQSVAQLATRRESIRLQIENLETSIKDWEQRALDTARRMSEYNRLKARVERAKSLSDRLLLSIQSVDVNKSLQPDVVSIMEHASTPTSTRQGIVKNMIVGGLAGLMLGVGFLSLAALLDDRISSAIDLQEQFVEQLLGQVPREKSDSHLNVSKGDDNQHVFAESYRNLRSALYFMSLEDPRPKTILITSAIPGEGKSTIAANMAITMANGGSKTLLIDGDLRKGVLHDHFSLPVEPGFAGVLTGEVKWRDAIVDVPIDHLFLLPRGRSLIDTGEHFLSKTTDRILQEIYDEFDYIFIDSAPVLAKDDTPSLAPKIDATIFIVRAGVSSTRMVRTALEALYKRQVNILGMVLNCADKASADYYYYHQYGEYHSTPAANEEV